MTDSFRPTDATPYPQAGLRLAVTYPASDGSLPESVELEWRDAPPGEQVAAIASLLIRSPAERYQTYRQADPS